MAVLLGIPGARADDTETARLREQVDALRHTVQELESRIRTLEEGSPLRAAQERPQQRTAPPAGVTVAPVPDPAAPVAPTAAAVAPAPSSTDANLSRFSALIGLKENWSRLNTVTTKAEVLAIVGKPEKELLINGKQMWYYNYTGIGRGSVFFTGDGQVSSIQPPNFGWGF